MTEEVDMDRCLVVANKTLVSDELLEYMRNRVAERPCQFHLLVPASRPWGSWTDGSIKAAARARLSEGLAHFAEHGITCSGEIGDANPVHAVSDVLLSGKRFDEVIISTMPAGPSAWIHQDVPTRVRRLVQVPVTHLISAPTPKLTAV